MKSAQKNERIYVSFNIFCCHINSGDPYHDECSCVMEKIERGDLSNAVTSDFSIYLVYSILALKSEAWAREYTTFLHKIFNLCSEKVSGWSDLPKSYPDIRAEYIIEGRIILKNGIKSVVSTNPCFVRLGIDVINPKDLV